MATERIKRQIDRLLNEAEEAVSSSDWDKARDRAQNVIALDSGNLDALTYLAAAERASASLATPASSPTHSALLPSAAAELPASFADGRYQVKRFLDRPVPHPPGPMASISAHASGTTPWRPSRTRPSPMPPSRSS